MLMYDPVIACDGHTYERSAIQQWMLKRQTSPISGAEMTSQHLMPNLAFRSISLQIFEGQQ